MYRRRDGSSSSEENETAANVAAHRGDTSRERSSHLVATAAALDHRRRVDRIRNDVTDDDDDESIFATRVQMSRRRSELMMSTEEFTDARSRDRMRFQDQRARLFDLARTFDPENRRTVCDQVRSLTVDYFTSLYDMSYRSFRFFDTACRQACSLAPVTLAVSAVAAVATRKSAIVAEIYRERSPPRSPPVTTPDWLTRRAIENFCRVHFYRAYEYLRCYELQRIILLEAFDRENYAEYVTALFLRENESLAKQREATVARWRTRWTTAAAAAAATSCRRRRDVSDDSGDALLERIAIVAKVIQCSRRATEATTDDATTPPAAAVITSLDLVIAASIQRTAVATAKSGRRRGSPPPPPLLSALASVWPSWNLRLSRYATSLAKARSVGNVDERVDIVRATGAAAVADDVAEWSCLSAESYDYMELYRQNAQHDRWIIRGDVDFYTNIFCTLFDVVVVSSPAAAAAAAAVTDDEAEQ